VFSPSAARVELSLFDRSGDELRIDLPAQTDGVWHGFVPGLAAGQLYGYRAHGGYEPEVGLRFNPNKLLIDPYARELAGEFRWNDSVFDHIRGRTGRPLLPDTADSAPFVPKSVVTGSFATPAGRHRIPWSDTLLYELNVRGYTMQHPAIDEQQRGRLRALGSAAVVAHLRSLGVTSVELMPIHACIDEEFLTRKQLRNFWGYNPINYFAIAQRLLGPCGLTGVRQTIETLHDAGIEVILDVVYNHTAESGRDGPTLSFRGLANEVYYRLHPEDRSEYINDTGCGNTLDTSEPMVRRLIVDSLAYSVEALGVDGFRFDLAATLARSEHGFDAHHALFAEIRNHPVLDSVKLIAEPWDVGPGGYRLGGFPPDWSEWNDRYRDAVRSFWRTDAGTAPDFARRIHGSSDIFEHGGRGPAASINFVTSHDGFTLADVVSYNEKHNEANGENNRDGHQHNLSTNHGAEGETTDPAINAARRRHRLNVLATLLFSQGTPMLLAGDEFGNSQSGNNNAYAQDNPIGWLDWNDLADDPAFFDEVCALTAVRREIELLRQQVYRHARQSDLTGHSEVLWFGTDGQPMHDDGWHSAGFIGVLFSGHSEETGRPMAINAAAILFNPGDADLSVRVPAIDAPGRWEIRYSTAGIASSRESVAGSLYVPAFSVVCLTHGPDQSS
jgi:glycogen operon protein